MRLSKLVERRVEALEQRAQRVRTLGEMLVDELGDIELTDPAYYNLYTQGRARLAEDPRILIAQGWDPDELVFNALLHQVTNAPREGD